jgi:AraC family transcriptional regulator
MQKHDSITFGKVLGKMETENFSVTEAKHSPGYKLPRHAHEEMNLACVLSGSFTESFARKEYLCEPQFVLFKPAGAVHSNQYRNAGSHTILISVKTGHAGKLEKVTGLFEDINLLAAGNNFFIIDKIYRELSAPDDLSALAVEGLSLELLTNFSRQLKDGSADPPWLAEAKDYIHANFREKLSLSKVAERVGTHPSHLARVFRRNFRTSIGDYIRHLRIDFAAGKLLESEKNLAEIAAESGFYDQSHFTHAFKNRIGKTPAEYRHERN